MKRIITLFLCFYSLLTYPVHLSDSSYTALKLKSITYNTYTKKIGSVYKKNRIDTIEYDMHGNKVRSITYDGQGNIISQYFWIYDRNQHLVLHSRYEGESIMYWYDFSYSESGDIISKTQYLRNNSKSHEEQYAYKSGLTKKTTIYYSDRERKYREGKIWRKTEETFNVKKEVIEYKEYREIVGGDGLFLSQWVSYEYYKNGAIKEELEFDINGKLDKMTTYKYTDYDSLSEFGVSAFSSGWKQKVNNYYNENKKIIKKEVFFDSHIYRIIYTYENNLLMEENGFTETDSVPTKKLISKYTYYENGILKNKLSYENTLSDVPREFIAESAYDQRGNLIKKTHTWMDGKIFEITLNAYDKNNNRIEFTRIGHDNSIIKHWKKKYNAKNEMTEHCELTDFEKYVEQLKYDERGNIVKRTKHYPKEKSFTKYNYEYY